MQGSHFIKECPYNEKSSSNGSFDKHYAFILFSAMSRNFLIKKKGIICDTFYKNGVIANESSQLNFIQNVIDLGNQKRMNMAFRYSKKEDFVPCFNWYINNKTILNLEIEIKNQINQPIKDFNNIKLPNSCTFLNKLSCEDCNMIIGMKVKTIDGLTTYHLLSEEWDLSRTEVQNTIIRKFAARRIYLYYYNILKNMGCKFHSELAKFLVYKGSIPDFFWYDKIGEVTPKKLNINQKHIFKQIDPPKQLWLTTINPKPIPDEKVFLEHYDLL